MSLRSLTFVQISRCLSVFVRYMMFQWDLPPICGECLCLTHVMLTKFSCYIILGTTSASRALILLHLGNTLDLQVLGLPLSRNDIGLASLSFNSFWKKHQFDSNGYIWSKDSVGKFTFKFILRFQKYTHYPWAVILTVPVHHLLCVWYI